jgi:hypothetical protein
MEVVNSLNPERFRGIDSRCDEGKLLQNNSAQRTFPLHRIIELLKVVSNVRFTPKL